MQTIDTANEKLEKLEALLTELNIEIFSYSTPFIIKIDGVEYGIYDKEDSYADVGELPRTFDTEILMKKY